MQSQTACCVIFWFKKWKMQRDTFSCLRFWTEFFKMLHRTKNENITVWWWLAVCVFCCCCCFVCWFVFVVAVFLLCKTVYYGYGYHYYLTEKNSAYVCLPFAPLLQRSRLGIKIIHPLGLDFFGCFERF